MRKMIVKKVAIVAVLLALAICLFLYGFGLVKVGDRSVGNVDLPQAVRERIEKECKVAEPEACAVYGMKLTCELFEEERHRCGCCELRGVCAAVLCGVQLCARKERHAQPRKACGRVCDLLRPQSVQIAQECRSGEIQELCQRP